MQQGSFAILVFTRTTGFYHDSIPVGVQAIRSLGVAHGFDVDDTMDAAAFTDENLARYRVVVFLNTTGDVLEPQGQAAFERFIRSGGGFVGIHSATDTEYDWLWYGGLTGAYFRTHPAVQPAVVRIIDASHPSTQDLPREWSRTDEWYDFRESANPNVRVLVTLDEASYIGGSMGLHHPVTWSHLYDGGRSWYTAMGHSPESYSDPLFQAHILGGITWTAGRDLPAEAPAPIPEVEQGPIQSGYLVLTPDGNSAVPRSAMTFGIVTGGVVHSQAGVVAAPLTTNASLFTDVIPATGRNLGLAFANPSSTAAPVTLTLHGSDGSTMPAATLILQPREQRARFISELFPSLSASFVGNLSVESTGPVSVLGLWFSGIHFSALPISRNEAPPATTIIFSQFALGGGWATQLSLTNDSAQTATGRIDLFDSAGNPMSVRLNGQTQSSFSYTIPAGGTFLLAPRDLLDRPPM
jgi:type 1 glutamine amidotransferase